MQLSHTFPVRSLGFDDPNLVSAAGLVPAMGLAERCGLHELAADTLTLSGPGGANPAAKVPVGPNTGIPAISDALRGQQPSDELYARAGAIAAESCSPATDNRGTSAYKRHLADELTRRTLRRAVERIQAGSNGHAAPGRNN